MTDNELAHSKFDDDGPDRKIDWPVVTTRVSPDTFALLEAARDTAGQKRGPFVRALIERAMSAVGQDSDRRVAA